MDRRRDVLASLSLILAARGLGCAQTELGKKQLYSFAFYSFIVGYGRRKIFNNPIAAGRKDLLLLWALS